MSLRMRDQPDKGGATASRLPIVLATGAGRLSGDSTSEIDEYGNELFYLGRSSNRRLVQKNFKTGEKETYEGPKGHEHVVGVKLPSGEEHWYEGARGEERRVRIIFADGNEQWYEGDRGEERIVSTRFPDGAQQWYKGAQGEEHVVQTRRPDGIKYYYEGAQGEERRVRIVGRLQEELFFKGPQGQERLVRKEWKNGGIEIFVGEKGSEQRESRYFPEVRDDMYKIAARTDYYNVEGGFVERKLNHYNGTTTFLDETGSIIKLVRPDGLEWKHQIIKEVIDEYEASLNETSSPRHKLAIENRLKLFANNGLLLSLTLEDWTNNLGYIVNYEDGVYSSDGRREIEYYFTDARRDPEIVRVAVKQHGDVLRTLDPVFEHNPSLRLVAAETSAHFALVVLTDMKKDLLQYDEKALDSYVRKFRRTAFGKYLFGAKDPELEAFRSYGDAASALAKFWSTPKDVKLRLSLDDIDLYEGIQRAAEEVLLITEDPKRILIKNDGKRAFEDDMKYIVRKRQLGTAAMEATTAAHWDHTLFDDATPSRPSPTGRSSSMVDTVVDGFVKARM